MNIMDEILKINATYVDDSIEERLNKLETLWNSLPQPQEEIQNSYLIIAKIVNIALNINDLEKAWMWAQRALAYSGRFNLAGESEYIVGEVAYERTDYDTARTYFLKVRKISGKRLFKGKNPKYFEITEQK